jgi:protein gp37
MGQTKIEWTDATWNPVTGCTKVSEGCRNCYAERIAMRRMSPEWKHMADDGLRPRRFTDVRCHEDRLEQPLHWHKARRVFVCSMSDLFHEDVPDEFIGHVFAVMALSERHTFQVLTKRPERMVSWLGRPQKWTAMVAQFKESVGAKQSLIDFSWPLANAWLGVSVEDQATADERIPLLLQTPAVLRFVSCEPLLGPIDFRTVPGFNRVSLSLQNWWIIVGGESGLNARPCNLWSVRSIIEQCKVAHVPCFVKQLGSQPHRGNPGTPKWPITDSKGALMEEWPLDLRVREWPREGG